MKTSAKITISCTALLAVLVALFFAAPYAEYKGTGETGQTTNYFQYACIWWKTKLQGKTIDGGTLPEITVTPKD